MDLAATFRRSAAVFNRAMVPLLGSGPGRRLLGGSFVVLTYRGRRSGREVTVPANYRRDGDAIVVAVLAPDAKTWWRNFTGEGSPVRARMGERVLEGHGVATRDARGRVTVRIAPATT